MASIAPATPKPALQIITSRRPKRSIVRATNASISAARVTSATIGNAWPPAAEISAAAASSRSSRRAQIATAAPSRARRSAVARPMPDDAPVIATTRIFQSLLVVGCGASRGAVGRDARLVCRVGWLGSTL